jgi:DNA-binding NarL/FixJ family response regulator
MMDLLIDPAKKAKEPKAGQIRILILKNDELTKLGLITLLEEPDCCEVIANIDSETKALQAIQEYKPDVVIIDYHLQGLNETSMIPQIQNLNPAIKIIIFSTHGTDAEILSILAEEPDAYFLESSIDEQFIDIIHYVMSGRKWLEPSVCDYLMRFISNTKFSLLKKVSARRNEKQRTLTEREQKE